MMFVKKVEFKSTRIILPISPQAPPKSGSFWPFTSLWHDLQVLHIVYSPQVLSNQNRVTDCPVSFDVFFFNQRSNTRDVMAIGFGPVEDKGTMMLILVNV